MNAETRKRGRIRRAGWLLSCWALAAVALEQTGCTTLSDWVHNGFKVGPNYQPPPAPLPQHWIDDGHPRVAHGDPNLAAWWDVFCDPILTKLIHDAAAQNLTVREAGFQILQAQIQRKIACTELLPQAQDLLASYTRGEVSRNNGVGPTPGPTFGVALSPSSVLSPLDVPSTPIAGVTTPLTPAGTTTTGTSPLINGVATGAGGGVPSDGRRFFSNFATSLNFAWELDFWGLFRRNLEAADASLEQSMHDYDELVVQLLANVATQYVEIRTLQKRLALARKNVREQEPLVDRLRQQYEAGTVGSKPAYFQLKSNLDNTRALIPPLEIALRQANNQLCVLLGIPVCDLLPLLGDGLMPDSRDPKMDSVRIPRAQDEQVVLCIPGDTLLHRPDVQAMEQLLRIQSAQIGIAEAEMLPHIGLNGSIGLAADRFGKLFNQQSWIGSIGPSLNWSILNYGRLLSNVRLQNYQYQQFVLAYQQTILNANQDVENALVAYLQSLEQYRYLQASADAAAEVARYYYDQLATGYNPPGATSGVFYNLIFTAVNFQVTQQDAAAQAEGNIALNLILLYRALGGGWQCHPAGALGDSAAAGAPPTNTAEALPPPQPVAPTPEQLPLPQPEPAGPVPPERKQP